MKKSVVVLGLAKLSIPQKIEYARFIVTSMTGNPNFTTPNPVLTVISTNATALETAHITAKGGGKDETALMKAKEMALDMSLKALSGYVESIANASPLVADAIVLSSGFSIRKNADAKANGFRLKMGKNPGEIDIKTDTVNRATFIFEMTQTPDDESSWEEIHSSTRAHFIATGLEKGKNYYFRYKYTDKDGTSPYSNVLSQMAF